MRNLKASKTTQKIGSLLLLSLFISIFTMQVNPAGLLPPGGQTQLVAEAGWGFWGRRRPRTRLTTRSTSFCEITPGLIKTTKIWHDRPLFKWEGQAVQINVREHESQKVIWSQSLDGKTPQTIYSGDTNLEPGKLYQWQVLGSVKNESDRNFWTTFNVMPSSDHKAIATDLSALTKKVGQGSWEAIVLEKADYFAEKNLWSDAIQVLYSVDQVSASFADQRSNYIQEFCGKSSVKTAVK
jgi:hypothetical protein